MRRPLGQDRCIRSLERQTEAVQPLIDARELFAKLGAAPARAEADLLLRE